MLSVTYAECHIQAVYAECRYAKCRYTECRGADVNVINHYASTMTVKK